MKKEENLTLPFLIALANIGLFGLMFVIMHYYELMGADPGYFDKGTYENIKNINALTGLFGFNLDPANQARVSTVMWSLCLGVSLVSTWATIVIANRKSIDDVETTEAAI